MTEETVEEIIDDGLDDLIDFGEPTNEEPLDESQATEEGGDAEHSEESGEQGTAKPDTDAVVDAGQESTGETEDTQDETYRYKGKEYSKDDLLSDPTLLDNLITAANQQTHYQDLHGQSKATIDEMQAQINMLGQAEQQRQAHDAQTQWTAVEADPAMPQKLTDAYAPAIKELVKTGWVEEDIAELYPGAVANFLALRDGTGARIQQLENVIGSLIQTTETTQEYTQNVQRREAVDTVASEFNNIFNTVASEGGIFEPLTKPEVRQEFLAELEQTMNPQVNYLLSDPAVLRSLWIAKNHKPLMDAASTMRQQEASRLEQSRRFAAGEGGGTAATNAGAGQLVAGEAEGWADL